MTVGSWTDDKQILTISLSPSLCGAEGLSPLSLESYSKREGEGGRSYQICCSGVDHTALLQLIHGRPAPSSPLLSLL